MLSVIRCDEIAKTIFSKTSEKRRDLHKSVENEYVDNFGALAKEMVGSSVSEFRRRACRYEDVVFKEREEKLRQDLIADLTRIFRCQVNLALVEAKKSFQERLNSEFSHEDPREDFPEVSASIGRETVEMFDEKCRLSVADGMGWSVEEEREQLMRYVRAEILAMSDEELGKIFARLKENTLSTFAQTLTEVVDAGRPDMWKTVREVYHEEKKIVGTKTERLLTSFDEASSKYGLIKKEYSDLTFTCMKEFFSKKVKSIGNIITQRFESHFCFEKDGKHITWKKGDKRKIEQIYDEAKKECERLLDSFCFLRLESSIPENIFFEASGGVHSLSKRTIYDKLDEYSKCVLLSPEDRTLVHLQFTDFAKKRYLVALEDLDKVSGGDDIMPYIMIVMFYFATDEIWWVLSVGLWNPLFLPFFSVGWIDLLPPLVPTQGFGSHVGKTFVEPLPTLGCGKNWNWKISSCSFAVGINATNNTVIIITTTIITICPVTIPATP
eukprot:TRINITY_DN6726_c0_g1_i13.p1 TRINITY_DN6726_c0_g1~~TRINITY_DN6726_c0_g1_i13.p1  ORF type:complete len:496 (+),score=107.13 TRINITY_DN6726_c0_g1_i13:404-1891(+)